MQKKDVNFEEIFPHAIDTCKIKERASDLDVENVVNNFLPTTMTEKCFVACWLETFHVVYQLNNSKKIIMKNWHFFISDSESSI